MFVSTPSGFADTPVTKRLVLFTAIVPIGISLMEAQYWLDLARDPHLTKWGQWWRIVLNQIAYTNQAQVLLAVLLLYNLRIMERLMGSHKYLSYMIVVGTLSLVTTPALIMIWSMIPGLRAINYIPPGPTAPIFGVLCIYHQVVPAVYRFQISSTADMRVQLTDKTFVYAIAAQLCMGGLPGSTVQAMVGWALGSLLYSGVIPGKGWRLPYYHKLGLDSTSTDNNTSGRGDSSTVPETTDDTNSNTSNQNL